MILNKMVKIVPEHDKYILEWFQIEWQKFSPETKYSDWLKSSMIENKIAKSKLTNIL